MKRLFAQLFAAALMGAAALPSHASTFVAWEVSGVAWDDVLNVRAYPSSTSRKQAAYPNGTVLSMTGKCTGGVNLHDVGHLSKSKQRAMVRTLWCQVWHDPAQSGDYALGWVYGRYITPQ